MTLILIFFSAWFSYFDLRYHLIRNKTLGIFLIALSCAAFIEDAEIHMISALFVSLLSIIGFKFGLGAGDVKLAAVLSLYFLPANQTAFSQVLLGFVAITSLSILAHLVIGRKMTDSIALAPAICGAFIWCAR